MNLFPVIMEQVMKLNNKTCVILTVAILFFSFAPYIIYSVINRYHNNLYLVSEKRIVEAAKKRVDMDICINGKITLKQLYENNLLEVESNPITKEIYNDESYIKVENNEYVLNLFY